MAYFAKIGVGDIVEKVIAVDGGVATSEQAGIEFLNILFQANDTWKQAYLDGSRRGYAGIGSSYDRESDSFTPPVTPFVDTEPGIEVPVRDRG